MKHFTIISTNFGSLPKPLIVNIFLLAGLWRNMPGTIYSNLTRNSIFSVNRLDIFQTIWMCMYICMYVCTSVSIISDGGRLVWMEHKEEAGLRTKSSVAFSKCDNFAKCLLRGSNNCPLSNVILRFSEYMLFYCTWFSNLIFEAVLFYLNDLLLLTNS